MSSPIQQLLAQQIEMMASNSGKSAADLWKEIGKALQVETPDDAEEAEVRLDKFFDVAAPIKTQSVETPVKSAEPAKRKYNRCQPSVKARDLEVGTTAFDERGRTHQVVMRKAFKGEVKAWKLLDLPVAEPSRPVDDAVAPILDPVQPQSNPVPAPRWGIPQSVGLVDYPDSDDEQEEVDTTTPSPPPSPEMKSKRKYTSTKPTVNPKDLEPGTQMEHGGKLWMVAVVGTRGNGKRSMWKLAPEGDLLSLPATRPVERANAVGPDDVDEFTVIEVPEPKGIWADAIHRHQNKLTWSCQTCLVENDKTAFQCAACQSLSPQARQTLMESLVSGC